MKRVYLGLLLLIAGTSCKLIFQELEKAYQNYRWGQYEGEGRVVLQREEGAKAQGDYVMDGPWVIRHDNGSVRAEGSYRNDHRVGAWTTYYESGAVEWQGEFDRQGYRSGAWTFHRDLRGAGRGAVTTLGSYREDLEHGWWAFFGEDEQLVQLGHFRDGERHGPWLSWVDGALVGHGIYENGERVGLWVGAGDSGAAGREVMGAPSQGRVAREMIGDRLRRLGLAVSERPSGAWVTLHESGWPRMASALDGRDAQGPFLLFTTEGRPMWRGRWASGRRMADVARYDAEARTWGTNQASLELAVLPPGEAGWTEDGFGDDLPADQLTARWRAELAGRVTAEDAASVAALPQIEVAAVPDVTPAPPQQEVITVRQQRMFADFVELYARGAERVAAGVMSSYGAILKRQQEARSDAVGPEQRWIGKPFPHKSLTTTDGSNVDLERFVGRRPVLFVILKGFRGEVCWYCLAQTRALDESFDRLRELGVRVYVIYPDPGQAGAADSFLDAYQEVTANRRPPRFGIYRDPQFAMCETLNITGGDWVYPTTVFVQKDGTIGYMYQGKNEADRPAFKDVLTEIENLVK